MDYHANGLVGTAKYLGGPQWIQENDPHQMARPSQIRSWGSVQEPWVSGTYRYDGSGNVASIGNDYYRYDRVSRVSYSFSPTNWTEKSYTYDSFGNRTDWPLNPNPATNRLSSGYSYDEAGNLTKDGSSILDYDGLNNLQALSDSLYGRNFRYIYTAEERRIGTHDQNSGAWTWDIRDLAGKVLSVYTSSGWSQDYIYRDGTLAGAIDFSGSFRPFMVDHLGTPRQITEWDGSTGVRHDYHAFGEEISNPSSDTEAMKFGGHQRDFCCVSNGIGADDQEGRFYSSTLGRMRSVGQGAAPSSPQSWNAYSAALNSMGDLVCRWKGDVYTCEVDVTGDPPKPIVNPPPDPGGGSPKKPQGPQPQAPATPRPAPAGPCELMAGAAVAISIGIGRVPTWQTWAAGGLLAVGGGLLARKCDPKPPDPPRDCIKVAEESLDDPSGMKACIYLCPTLGNRVKYVGRNERCPFANEYDFEDEDP